MAGFIHYKEDTITYTNSQYSSTMVFVSKVADKMAKENELEYLEQMKAKTVDNHSPELRIDVEKDIPTIGEKKFWARMFYETAREIFERKIGVQDYYFWQSQRISQIYGTGDLITKAIKEIEPAWIPDIRDFNELDEWTNNQ